MWRLVLFITAANAVPVFRATPLAIVLEEMRKDFRVEHSVLVEKLLSNPDLGLTPEQADNEATNTKRMIVIPFVKPEWFHNALASFQGEMAFWTNEFRDHFWSYVPATEAETYLDDSYRHASVSAWLRYCIIPMRNGNITCRPVTDGDQKIFWALTDEAIVEYIGDFNWKTRLAAFN